MEIVDFNAIFAIKLQIIGNKKIFYIHFWNLKEKRPNSKFNADSIYINKKKLGWTEKKLLSI